jgi:4'-phosphopantetheinyl transferase EntD
MPLEKIEVENERAWALWRITEDEAALRAVIDRFEMISGTLNNPQKRLEWLSGRMAAKTLMESLKKPFHGIIKDKHGKPFLKDHRFHLSLSHSFPYVAVLIDFNHPAGIDLEQPKSKLIRVASRIHHQEELRDLGTDIVKHCVYWCAKESLVKLHGKKDLIFSENMFIEPFELEQAGNITGRMIFGQNELVIPLHYTVYTDFVVVYTMMKNT